MTVFIAFQSNSQATVDSNTTVFIVIQHVQSGEYYTEKAPIIGCWGIQKGPELAQLTKPYVVSNLGCGMESRENINALTCAKVTNFVESDDSSTFKTITLDISGCEDKNNPDFILAIKKVVKLNFATKTLRNPALTIVK
jgi:hypothetical protein